MAAIRSLMELTPVELMSRPMVRRFGPFRENIIRTRAPATWKNWFGVEWFWIGRSIGSAHTILVGPFRTKRGAKRAWANVPDKDPRYFFRDDQGRMQYAEPAVPPGERALQKSFSDYHRG